MTGENRQAVRVTSRILFTSLPVSEEKFKQIQADFDSGISPYNRQELADIQVYIGAQSALAKLKDRDAELGTFLQHLDGKINLLLKKVDNSPNLLDRLVLQPVNIGANGLAFWAEKAFVPGDILELQIVLPPEHVFIDCFGTVVKCAESKGEEAEAGTHHHTFRVSVSFVLIVDADREELVHYNFRQQSLALQRRRVEKEDR